METKPLRLSHPWKAWIIWLLSAIFMFYKYALEVSPSVMTGTLMSTFQISGAQLGVLAATYFYAYLLLQIPAGFLIDRFGPRKMTTIAIAVCGAGSLVFSSANTLFIAEVGRFFIGAGAAFAAVNCLKLTANWFPYRQFAFMAGLMMTIAMLGAVGGQAPLASFIEVAQWRPAMRYIAFAGLILALVFWVIVRDKAPDHTKEKMFCSTRVSLLNGLKQILSSSQSLWLSIYSGFAFAPVMVFGGLWGVAFLQEAYQLSETIAARQVSLIFIGFAVGAPIFGYLSDRVGKRKGVMFWGTLCSLFMISAVIYVPGWSVALISTLLFLFGFCISSFLLCFTMIREVNAPLLAATAIGFMNAFDALFGAVSDPLTGKILDSQWSGETLAGARVFTVAAYKLAFITLPIFLIIALISLWKIKETYCKPSYPNQL
ncbi:MAG TPA: MFS transporter, partial [Chlamydiales bacterium]|nr:MFS transporter [Chlamydiales bacterium]